MEKSKSIFGNELPERSYRKALHTKQKYCRKYGDDGDRIYHLAAEPAPAIGSLLGVQNLRLSEEPAVQFDAHSIIIGSIRMGFGHYRIAMAMASAAHAMGYQPYWFDLHAFGEAACGKIIGEQNQLYSLGSRLSQQLPPFNKLVWEPLNSEGFRRLSYNCSDQKTAELMTGVYCDFPKDIPFIAAHVWPSQAAVHAGLTHVVNAVPDNWPMALHLSEGAVHTVQTPSACLGYRALRGMNGSRPLKPMPKGAVVCTGHYVDHEIVSNLEADCAQRIRRMRSGAPKRWLLSVGGAGAQKQLFVTLIRRLMPAIKKDHAALLVNVGDHAQVWKELMQEIPEMQPYLTEHFDRFQDTAAFCGEGSRGEVHGIHAFCHRDIFAAVYSTNLLMRISDVLITKPSELSFYPVPKLMLPRVGGHEAWGAIRAAEIGDGTYECSTPAEAAAMMMLLQKNGDIIEQMCRYILCAKKAGIYDGAYKAVRLAFSSSD
ncbi:MAG: hypothetical protein IKI77_05085 [Oscillospiraceae bacterium]|nr:hypothetical protein [Oscillospiraceae bacterium]